MMMTHSKVPLLEVEVVVVVEAVEVEGEYR
jgi:hypothetical protein